MVRHGDTPEPPSAIGGDPDLNAILFEAIERVASPRARRALIVEALAAAGTAELPADIRLLLEFVVGPLQRAATGTLGEERASALVSDVQPLLERVLEIRSRPPAASLAPPASTPAPPSSSQGLDTLPPSGLFRGRGHIPTPVGTSAPPVVPDAARHGTLPYLDAFEARVDVLLVDDDMAFLRGLSRLMRAAGLTVVTAPDGGTGVRICERLRPGLIISDLDMPPPNGVEVAALLAARLGDDAPPLVLLTGASNPPVGGLGIRKVLRKSIRPDQLLVEIQALLPPRSP